MVNAFLGGMVGLDRTTTSLSAPACFAYPATWPSSLIIAFGLTKAASNLAARPLTARYTRKALLVAGWVAGLPVPFLLAYAPAGDWIVAADVLLGVNRARPGR